jgi:hypothetical protein
MKLFKTALSDLFSETPNHNSLGREANCINLLAVILAENSGQWSVVGGQLKTGGNPH